MCPVRALLTRARYTLACHQSRNFPCANLLCSDVETQNRVVKGSCKAWLDRPSGRKKIAEPSDRFNRPSQTLFHCHGSIPGSKLKYTGTGSWILYRRQIVISIPGSPRRVFIGFHNKRFWLATNDGQTFCVHLLVCSDPSTRGLKFNSSPVSCNNPVLDERVR